MIIMKRYLYILFAAVVALVSCEPVIIEETKPDVVYYFSNINVETSENSATVEAVKPYITVDGKRVENPVIYLEYWMVNTPDSVTKIEEYTSSNGYIIFELKDLMAKTSYQASVTIVSEYGQKSCAAFPVTTKEHIPVAEYSCECEIEAKGLYADVVLSNVQFTLDAEAQPIESVVVEYRRKYSGSGEWIAVSVDGSTLENGAATIRIPADGEQYLEECREYSCRVTINPEDANYDSYTITKSFETLYAEVVADIATPVAEITNDNLLLSVDSVRVYFDGIELDDYYNLRYGFIYREQGDDEIMTDGDFIEVEYDEASGMSLSMPLSSFEQGATYEFYGAVISSVKMPISECVLVTIPVEEPPTPPTPPAPPVSGDADTTALAGDWHLTEWRGSVPSFDVYLSITEDGVVTLYQRMDSRLWETYYSSVGFEQGVISGVYTDGVVWGASYYVTVEGDTMVWTDTADSGDVSVYTRCTLPDVTNPEIRPTSLSESPRFL